MGLHEEATEIYVYIDIVTKAGRKMRAFEKGLPILDRAFYALARNIKFFSPHMENQIRLFRDPEFRDGRLAHYRTLLDIYNARAI